MVRFSISPKGFYSYLTNVVSDPDRYGKKCKDVCTLVDQALSEEDRAFLQHGDFVREGSFSSRHVSLELTLPPADICYVVGLLKRFGRGSEYSIFSFAEK